MAFYVPQNGVHKTMYPKWGTNGVQNGVQNGVHNGGTKEGAEVNLLVKDGHTGFLCTPKWGT